MARLPDETVERIRREISVQRLAEARGIQLRRMGKNMMGLCPFHQDKNPSLSITPSTNKWHCLGCGKGGTAIDWVMHTEGVSTRHALEMLSRDLVPMTPAGGGPPPKKCTVPKLPPLIQQTNDDKKLVEIVVSYYHKTLKEKPEAQQYLVKRGLQSAEMVEHFRLGYSNRTLGYHLPASNRLAGAEQRGRLTELGIYRESGHEHFSGSLVIPILNLNGEVVQMYGRKITPNLRAGTPDHLYLPGPLRGVWNEQALIASKEIILCEALIDALTFWCAGYRNVTTIYGVNNFTDELDSRSRGVMRVNVKVSGRNVRGEYSYHGDTLDMESFRQRATFTKQAAHELGAKEETIHAEVGKLWAVLGDLQREHIRKTLAQPVEETIMNAEEQAAALELLRDPRLLERVLSDFDKCGVVGEETNKRVSYLAAVSRLLEKPLAIVVQSSSSAGKSSLMEAVLDFMPEEQREEYSAMTGQALFYMGQKNLKHKILAVSEEEGAQRAAYALKLLQSEGVLKIASTGKDPVSGKLVTHEYIVEGPVMIFLTTTAQEVDEELVNRSIVLTVNEEQAQTRAIHQKQREAQTIEGLWARRERQKIVKLHRNAQRLLRPIPVVNNHMHDDPDFPDHLTRTRRDHMKFLTLIETIALLHQHQREIKTDTRHGETLEYIEATKDDVKLARELVRQVLAPSLDELPAHTRRLLVRIEKMAQEECERLQVESDEYRFTRRTVRQYTRWGDTQLRCIFGGWKKWNT